MTRGYAAIGLCGTKNTANLGGAFRAAHCYGAGLIILQSPRLTKAPTDTTKAFRHIPTIVGNIIEHRPYDCPMVVVELAEGATPLPDFKHPERALYVFGPEDGSVSKELTRAAQFVVQVPTHYCMNLAATVNVVLYDRLAKRASRPEPAP